MDERRFDMLARNLAGGHSRRRVLAGLLGLGSAAVGVPSPATESTPTGGRLPLQPRFPAPAARSGMAAPAFALLAIRFAALPAARTARRSAAMVPAATANAMAKNSAVKMAFRFARTPRAVFPAMSASKTASAALRKPAAQNHRPACTVTAPVRMAAAVRSIAHARKTGSALAVTPATSAPISLTSASTASPRSRMAISGCARRRPGSAPRLWPTTTSRSALVVVECGPRRYANRPASGRSWT